jgi:hypothetical protein
LCPAAGPSTPAADDQQSRPDAEVDDAPRLRGRLELILEMFKNQGPGPYRGKVIATTAQLDYDSRLRADLSELKGLGYLDRDKDGYVRTGKPYP